jgi:hypothetical protein
LDFKGKVKRSCKLLAKSCRAELFGTFAGLCLELEIDLLIADAVNYDDHAIVENNAACIA